MFSWIAAVLLQSREFHAVFRCGRSAGSRRPRSICEPSTSVNSSWTRRSYRTRCGRDSRPTDVWLWAPLLSASRRRPPSRRSRCRRPSRRRRRSRARPRPRPASATATTLPPPPPRPRSRFRLRCTLPPSARISWSRAPTPSELSTTVAALRPITTDLCEAWRVIAQTARKLSRMRKLNLT